MNKAKYSKHISDDKERFAPFVESLRINSNNKSIAKEHKVLPPTVSYWRRKLAIPRPNNDTLKYIPKRLIDRKFYPLEDELLGDKINVGKSYIDYVKESAERGEQTAIHTLTKGFLSKGI